jgi:hypothetical protein
MATAFHALSLARPYEMPVLGPIKKNGPTLRPGPFDTPFLD